jgi:hypothetical protein
VVFAERSCEACQPAVWDDHGPDVSAEARTGASVRTADPLDVRQDFPSLVIDAQEPGRSRVADGLEVLKEKVNRRRPGIHRPSDRVADPNDATMLTRSQNLLHDATVARAQRTGGCLGSDNKASGWRRQLL